MSRRVAIITGGASGLGRATAHRLAADGLTVVIADLDLGTSALVAAGLSGPDHLGVGLDAADETSVTGAFDEIEDARGPVAVLVHFAGINSILGRRQRTPIVDMPVEEWDGVLQVNARGTFLCVREMMRRRLASPLAHSRIVTVGSLAGQVGGIASGAAYSASKGAVHILTKVAARECLPSGMTVNSIAPGPIDSPLLRASVASDGADDDFSASWDLPLGRLGHGDEVAAAASYLVSEEAAYVTGSTIDVNGGLNMR